MPQFRATPGHIYQDCTKFDLESNESGYSPLEFLKVPFFRGSFIIICGPLPRLGPVHDFRLRIFFILIQINFENICKFLCSIVIKLLLFNKGL